MALEDQSIEWFVNELVEWKDWLRKLDWFEFTIMMTFEVSNGSLTNLLEWDIAWEDSIDFC